MYGGPFQETALSWVDQHVAIGMATEAGQATRRKDSLSLSRAGQHFAIGIATERSATTRLKDSLPCGIAVDLTLVRSRRARPGPIPRAGAPGAPSTSRPPSL